MLARRHFVRVGESRNVSFKLFLAEITQSLSWRLLIGRRHRMLGRHSMMRSHRSCHRRQLLWVIKVSVCYWAEFVVEIVNNVFRTCDAHILLIQPIVNASLDFLVLVDAHLLDIVHLRRLKRQQSQLLRWEGHSLGVIDDSVCLNCMKIIFIECMPVLPLFSERQASQSNNLMEVLLNLLEWIY